MQGFRERNRFLIYLVNFSGLYLKSVEGLTEKKWLLRFLTVWTKIAIVLIPIYIGSTIKFVIFDEAPLTLKMAVFRRVIAFSSFLFKNVFFYLHRKKIEGLIDLWDSYYKEELYSEDRNEKLRKNEKVNVKILSLSWILTLTASLIYTVPPFFSEVKRLTHPSGIPYREQTPDYELMVTFDFFRVVMGCLSAVSLDCILIVLLSLVQVQLSHLKDTLTNMVNEISIDSDGNIIYKRTTERFHGVEDYNSFRAFDIFEKNRSGVLGAIKNSREYKNSIWKFDKEMRIWILHHQQTIRFYEAVKGVFTPVASLQLVYVVFYTCFTAFHLVRAKMGIDVFVIPFIASSNLISLFVWCRIGVYVDALSSELFGDAFGRSWFFFPKKIQTAFSFIIIRGWKPLTLRGISLFDLNLFTFFQVFKITYQLFAFMLHVSSEH